MSSGTSGSYWADKALPSVFKHELLKGYLAQFGGMTGSRARDKRVVYLDGYAGEGRYENGEPASAEIALQIADHHRARGLTMECFFAESDAKSYARLLNVLEHYARRGVLAHHYHGEVNDVLDSLVHRAQHAPLFLFLDPCGLTLPLDRLTDVLACQRPRHQKWPPTELLMNFSMMAVWRLGGHVRSPKGNMKSLERFDGVCGGTWWREYFADAAARPHKEDIAQDAIDAVAAEYAHRLEERTGMLVQSVPVSDSPRHRAVYRLVFATRSQYGLWVFGDNAAHARDAWWKTLDAQEESNGQLALVPSRPDPADVTAQAVPKIAANLERLLTRTHRPVRLVDHTLEIFGDFYGQVPEAAARTAVQLLHRHGKTPTSPVGARRIREITVRPGPMAA
ncbi:three-Cys-motif partner protein TcmP [Streptomyces longhuiensis]|uniref:three-Cys-motif partner protein TcmP n=1 Tax=Streptomyces longhuiensis TaxID=2880933 RepID=UPI001D0A644F|nr:three-Cys-motif partner protein TcmP [Streptomyces longhuiensis]UDM05608.1 three-Cys-motif partner protein TcmP [Streptomyces longhuiensis]